MSLKVAHLACDVPAKVNALEETGVGLLSGAAHGQVHHSNSGHFGSNNRSIT